MIHLLFLFLCCLHSVDGFSFIPITAWPASWIATNLFSLSVILRLVFAGPNNTLSVASSISSIVMFSLSLLTASNAASFNKFSKSAPLKPGVL